jgi:sulfur carrier protein
MELSINGEQKNVVLTEPTVAVLIDTLELPTSRIAVEVNGSLIRRTMRNSTILQKGDRVEIVTLVGGG